SASWTSWSPSDSCNPARVPPVCPLPNSLRHILCYVTDRRSLPLSTSADAHRLLLDSIASAAAAGVDWIQLREKDYSGKEWTRLGRETLKRRRGARSLPRNPGDESAVGGFGFGTRGGASTG